MHHLARIDRRCLLIFVVLCVCALIVSISICNNHSFPINCYATPHHSIWLCRPGSHAVSSIPLGILWHFEALRAKISVFRATDTKKNPENNRVNWLDNWVRNLLNCRHSIRYILLAQQQSLASYILLQRFPFICYFFWSQEKEKNEPPFKQVLFCIMQSKFIFDLFTKSSASRSSAPYLTRNDKENIGKTSETQEKCWK